MSPHDSLLLDTNIWLDYYLGNRPGSAAAQKLFALASEAGIGLLYAVSTSKDVYFLVKASLKNEARAHNGGRLSEGDAAVADEIAWSVIDNMERYATAVATDATDVWVATKQRNMHRDYEDNLVVAAALRSKATCLITNDEQLRKHSIVATQSVEGAVASLTAGLWK